MLFIVGKNQQLNAHPWAPPSMTKSPWPGGYISDVELENLSVSVTTCYCGLMNSQQWHWWTVLQVDKACDYRSNYIRSPETTTSIASK
jgi:hypothetical protein